jgi:hypothetical protein
MATSYNGWPASSSPSAIGIVHFEPVPGHDFPAGIKGGDVKTVFTYLVQQLHKRVEPIVIYPPGDEWGYAYRANVNNPSVLSCHASGTAIDYNATEHPNRVPYTWTREQAREIHQIIDEELNGVIKWLEGYDEMHFEIRGTASAVAAVAEKIRAGTAPTPVPVPSPTPPPPPGDEMFSYEYMSGTTNVLVLVAFGKQSRITNHAVRKRRAAAVETHLGQVDQTEVDLYRMLYGPVFGL